MIQQANVSKKKGEEGMATTQVEVNSGTKKHIKSLREYIDVLKDLGELQEINQEVDPHLEIGAIARRCYETCAPAALFNNIKGVTPGFRVLGAPIGVSRQEGLYMSRVAVSLGLDPRATGQEMIRALVEARRLKGIPPKRVATGPCKENKKFGDEVDLLSLQAPLLHDGDGGRYFNTLGMVVVQTPDKKWTNWSIARIMLLDKNRMVGLVWPLQHIQGVHQAWKDIGKDMPFALVQGCEPFMPFVCGMPLPPTFDTTVWPPRVRPPFVNEADYVGAYFGEGVEVVKCETSDLEVPATAEIVIEGTLSITETAHEGPMGEYAGYFGEHNIFTERADDHWPVYHVTAITHRNNPILPVSVAGEPVEEDHTACGIPSAAETMVQLQDNGIPVTMVWTPFASANHWCVVTVPRNWRDTMNCTAEDFCRKIGQIILASKLGPQVAKMMVINDDIDPTNLQELVWGFATRCHPGEGEIVLRHQILSPLIGFGTKSERHTLDGPKSVYNCLRPEDYGSEMQKRSSFRYAYPKELQEKVIANWRSYGFTHP